MLTDRCRLNDDTIRSYAALRSQDFQTSPVDRRRDHTNRRETHAPLPPLGRFREENGSDEFTEKRNFDIERAMRMVR
jgi:hypothetical protein